MALTRIKFVFVKYKSEIRQREIVPVTIKNLLISHFYFSIFSLRLTHFPHLCSSNSDAYRKKTVRSLPTTDLSRI